MTKQTKWHVLPAKTQISLVTCPVWSASSLSAWRKLGFLATNWAHSEDSAQTGRTVILLVLSWGGSIIGSLSRHFEHATGWEKRGASRPTVAATHGFIADTNEPAVLFVHRKLILQTLMRSHPVGLDVWFLVGPFVYFHTSCVRIAKILAGRRGCAGSPEPSLVAYVISTVISLFGWTKEQNIVISLHE